MEELYYQRLSSKVKECDMKNMGPGDIGEMSAKTHEAANKKKQCEKIAQQMVEYLIDRTLDPTTFTRCLKHINQEHYADIVEERSISKMCGYPICHKKLPNMPAKKYHISTKQNKVYDITERKNFCSNFCFTASSHIKNQIETSPLWLRSPYTNPDFALLESSEKVKPGTEYGENTNVKSSTDEFTTVESFAMESAGLFTSTEEASSEKESESANDQLKKTDVESFAMESAGIFASTKVESSEKESDSMKDRPKEADVKSFKSVTVKSAGIFAPTKEESSEKQSDTANDHSKKTDVKSTKKVQFCEEDNLEIYDEELQCSTANKSIEVQQRSILKKSGIVAVEKSDDDDNNSEKAVKKTIKLTAVKELVVAREQPDGYENMPKKQMKTIKNQSSSEENELVERIQKCLNEWLTLETFLFLYGEETLKRVFQEHELQDDILKSLKQNANSYVQRQKYQDICKRLNLMALADQKFDSAVLRNSKKPLPDYKQIKEQSKVMDIQVKSFLQGKEVEIEEGDSDDSAEEEEEDNSDAERKTPLVLPLSDSSSQNALRRKVFLTSVNRVIHKMIQSLDLCSTPISSDISFLVNTFRLQAHNIVFKPKQWNLVGLILIKILSIKDSKLRETLETKESHAYASEVLSSLKQSDDSLEPILTDSLNINKYIINIYLK